MLREAAFDDFVEPVIFFACQETQATNALAAMADLPCGVDGGLVVVDTFAIAKRNEGLVSVSGGRCLAVRAQPAFKLLRRNFSGGDRSEGFPDDLGFADIAAAILVVDYEL